jgi:very-short-patch-repair endonuclease
LEGGLLVVDMACSATRVVVEFDGPWHHLSHVQSGELSDDGNSLLTQDQESLSCQAARGV